MHLRASLCLIKYEEIPGIVQALRRPLIGGSRAKSDAAGYCNRWRNATPVAWGWNQ